MNFQKAWLMARTEIKMVFKSKQVRSIPLILVIMSVGFSAGVGFLMIEFAQGTLTRADFAFIMIPIMGMAVVAIPIMLPMMIAADSIVGEKERNTLLPLLKTPLTDNELLMGKYLTALVPGLLVAYANFVLATVCLNGVILILEPAYLWVYPDLLSILQAIVLPPLFSGLSVCIMIMLSTKVDKVYEAYQTAGVIIIPVMLLVYVQFIPSISLHWLIFLAGVGVMAAANYFCFILARNIFNRDELMSRK